MNEIIKKNGIKFGLIIGIIAVLSQVLLYIEGNQLYKNTLYGIFVIFVFWGVRIYQSITTKKELKGLITFKEAFTTLLISTTIGILISISFNYVFYNFVATEFKPELNEFMNTSQLQMYKMMGKSSKEISDLANNDNFSIKNLLQGAVFSILISSIFNIILAGIFKSKQSYQQ